MNGERWHTKEDVLNDLAEATGRKLKDLNEGFFIVGGRPPPPLVLDDDDVVGFHNDMHDKAHEEVTAGPDLKGITRMLRMVQDNDDDDLIRGNGSGSQNPSNDIILISKLNPNVSEFMPKSASSSSVGNNKEINESNTEKETHTDKCVNNKITNKKRTNVAQAEKENSNDINKTDGSQIDNHRKSNEIDNMATILKNKICEASKSNMFQVKREKNIAIATLLKLYSKPSPSKSPDLSTNEKHLKLYTPQFFQSCKAKVDLNDDIVPEQTDKNKYVDEETQLTPNMDETLKLEGTTNNIPSTDKVESISVSDSEMKKSIDKVDKWLNNEPNAPKSKGPTIFLGPVAFKRKEPTANCNSPTEIVDKKIPKPGEYKPSKYAEELGKKYMERSKAKVANTNMWTKLENDLKEKDRVIREHLKNQSTDDQGNFKRNNGEIA